MSDKATPKPPEGLRSAGKALWRAILADVGRAGAWTPASPPPESPPDMERLLPIAARNGFNILGPPGPPPGR